MQYRGPIGALWGKKFQLDSKRFGRYRFPGVGQFFDSRTVLQTDRTSGSNCFYCTDHSPSSVTESGVVSYQQVTEFSRSINRSLMFCLLFLSNVQIGTPELPSNMKDDSTTKHASALPFPNEFTLLMLNASFTNEINPSFPHQKKERSPIAIET